MRILGIESSCDDTAAAIVQDAADPTQRILSNVVHSQMDHIVHGGVVPEIAARAHLEKMQIVIDKALKDANTSYDKIDAVAATCGPGLIGGVMVGMMAGKAISYAINKPFLGINHLEGHALNPRLTDNVEFPYLLLLVSGGHTQLLIVRGLGQYVCLGTTLDDAAGECFDKSAKMMGLPFPGGHNLEKLAKECSTPEQAYKDYPLPTPMKGRKNCDFSFSGLKTAVRTYIEQLAKGLPTETHLPREEMSKLAASFEHTMTEILKNRVEQALKHVHKENIPIQTLVVSGGVAANLSIRTALKELTEAHKIGFIAPPLKLCTDNGAMIAWAGLERFKSGEASALDFRARPRWPLSELA